MSNYPATKLHPLRSFQDRTPDRAHLSTLIRWAIRGIRTPNGKRIHLRAVRVGHKWATCEEWFNDFIQAVTAASLPDEATTSLRSPAKRRRDSTLADREAAAAGY